MDKAKTETDAMETLEMGNNTLPGSGETWRPPGTSRTWSSWNKSLAHVPNTCDTRSPEQRLLAKHRAGKHCRTIQPTTLLSLNRRMRTRMSGGVRGGG
jgi:hypothetical protein